MSSLLQHHGCTTAPKPGRVELLMYLTERYEQRPLSCCNCGHEWRGERDCAGCGAFVLFVLEHQANGDRRELLTTEESMQYPEYAKTHGGKHPTCYVNNWWGNRDSETVTLTRPDGSTTTVPKLYRVWRKPAGMCGCWVVFRWNGEEHVPDLSTPIDVEQLPRDADPLTDDEAARYWFN